jgi:hypothetical protein
VESERFDDLVRGAFEHASRRRVVRVGIGALAASGLTTLGLTSGDMEAKKKGKKKKKKKGTPPTTCPANLPVTCGTGCCPNEYSLCCVGNLGSQGGGGLQAVALEAAGDSTCNPPSFTCCPVEQGGGSCGGNFPKCCPATTQRPFGLCTESDATCCPSTAGGSACPAERPKCCPGGYQGQNINQYSECCLASEACCQATTDCQGAGEVCSGNCCRVPPAREPSTRSASVPRSGIAAR